MDGITSIWLADNLRYFNFVRVEKASEARDVNLLLFNSQFSALISIRFDVRTRRKVKLNEKPITDSLFFLQCIYNKLNAKLLPKVLGKKGLS